MLDPRQVEAALERFMDQADEVSDEYEPVVVLAAAARAWLAEGDATPEAGSLSTPTEPTDEPKRYYLCQHEDYESRKDCEQYGLDPVWDEGLDCRWVLIVEEASRAEETP